MPARACLAGVAILGLVACGGFGTGSVPDPTPPAQALFAWRSFPASQVPRPIVLFGIDAQGQAFTNGSKIAAICRQFALSIDLPSDIPNRSTASWPDGTTVTYPAISAADAFAAMKRAPGATGDMCSGAVPLAVTGAHVGVASFATDRGMAQISAWLFTATGAAADFIYPAIPASAIWRGGITNRSGDGGATVSADGRTLNFGFVGGECDAGYKSAVAESQSAVAVAVQAIPKDGSGYCSLVGISRSITVTLASPLGGRVVVDASGTVVGVCPEATRASC